MAANPQRFTAQVDLEKDRAWIPFPGDPAAVWGDRDRYHLAGRIDGTAWRGPLSPGTAPAGGGGWAVKLGPAWLRDHPLVAGQSVEVELWAEGPQPDEGAEDVVAAFSGRPAAARNFASLTSFCRNNWMRYVDEAKRPETRAKRIAEMVAAAESGKGEDRG